MKYLTSAAVVAMTITGGAASAATHNATITFDDDPWVSAPFTLDLATQAPGVVPDGKCASGKCLKVNSNGGGELTIEAGLEFSISEFWFLLVGNNNFLNVQTSKSAPNVVQLKTPDYKHNQGYVYTPGVSAPLNEDAFKNITWISFITDGSNTALVDNIKLTWDDEVAPVPLPAAGFLMLGGLAALGLARRRKAA